MGASLRSSDGGSLRFMMSTSRSPSLSKSPKAQPRLTWRDEMAGPVSAPSSTKVPIALIAEDETRIAGGIFCVDLLEFRRDRAGNNENVGIAVIVEVDQSGAPTDEAAFAAETGAKRYVFEFSLAIVAVEASGLVYEVGLHQVDVTVEIVVSDPDSHAAEWFARAAEGDAAQQSLFAKRAIVIVHQKKTGRGVAGHEDVLPAVLVGVEGDRGKAVGASQCGNAGLLGNIGKRSVAVVAIEGVVGHRRGRRGRSS